MGLRIGGQSHPARSAALPTLVAALGVLSLAACGSGSGPGAGISPRPSLSLPASSGSAGAGRPQPTGPAPTIPARPVPTTTTPATAPPATAPPATAPPATAPPATAPPATAPPATAPPATAPPATAPPATPALSPSPTSKGPGWWLFLTGAVARLVGQSPTPAPPATGAESSSSTSISPWWWLLVAAIVIGLAVGGTLLWRRRRARKTWADELGRVTTELRWGNDQLIPTMLAAPTAGEFAQAWTGGRLRLVAADQQLYALARRAPDETRAASIRGLRTAIASLMAAIDAEAGLGSTDADALRVARADVERARAAFSAALDAAEGKPKPASPEPSMHT
jgi:hypothetical protein